MALILRPRAWGADLITTTAVYISVYQWSDRVNTREELLNKFQLIGWRGSNLNGIFTFTGFTKAGRHLQVKKGGVMWEAGPNDDGPVGIILRLVDGTILLVRESKLGVPFYPQFFTQAITFGLVPQSAAATVIDGLAATANKRAGQRPPFDYRYRPGVPGPEGTSGRFYYGDLGSGDGGLDNDEDDLLYG